MDCTLQAIRIEQIPYASEVTWPLSLHLLQAENGVVVSPEEATTIFQLIQTQGVFILQNDIPFQIDLRAEPPRP